MLTGLNLKVTLLLNIARGALAGFVVAAVTVIGAGDVSGLALIPAYAFGGIFFGFIAMAFGALSRAGVPYAGLGALIALPLCLADPLIWLFDKLRPGIVPQPFQFILFGPYFIYDQPEAEEGTNSKRGL